jgi:chitin-binding protein
VFTTQYRPHLLLAVLLAGVTVAQPAPPPAVASGLSAPAWQQAWAPSPAVDGLRAFEMAEDDRANSHRPGQPHIIAEGSDYRFTMHTVDRDISTDRQRNEVRGMAVGGVPLILHKGETWRFTQSMFIPGSLKATTRFTHIMQTKKPGAGSGPMMTVSLRRSGSSSRIQLEVGGSTVASTNLVPLQDRWIDMELEMTLGDSSQGKVRWVIKNGAATVLDVTRSRVDTWLGDRARPKWGIYRSLGGGSVQNCYLLLTKMRAYVWSARPAPPPGTLLEAEDAKVSDGVVETTYAGYRGKGYVNPANKTGSGVEWTVNAVQAGPATLTFWYANANSSARPMNLVVNGAPGSTRIAFDRTAQWQDWDSISLVTSLRAGANTIRLTSATTDGGPNLDTLQVGPPPVTE